MSRRWEATGWFATVREGCMDLGQLMEGESGLALSVGKMCQLVGLNVELGRKRHLRVARG